MLHNILFDYIFHIYVLSFIIMTFYDIFVTYLYVHYIFFKFCFIFLFSYYLILNFCDNAFVFTSSYVQNCYNEKFLLQKNDLHFNDSIYLYDMKFFIYGFHTPFDW